MTTDAAAKTTAETRALIEKLATAETACPKRLIGKLDGNSHAACKACNGTSQVARVPAARRKCHTWRYKPDEAKHDERCCGGTGWLPNYDVRIEALLAGLTKYEASSILDKWGFNVRDHEWEGPMPPEDEIFLAFLRASVEVLDAG